MATAIQLASLVVASFFIIRAGGDTEQKLINFLIIAGSAALGAIATRIIEYAIASTQEMAPGIAIISAYVGCAIAGAWNYWRSGGIYKGKKSPGNKSDRTIV